MAGHDRYVIEPDRLAFDWSDRAMPLACIDLDRAVYAPVTVRPPPFPVIGWGDAMHPLVDTPALVDMLDVLIEPPVTLDRIVAQVTRHPRAAAALVQLLRTTGGVPVEHALQLESMCYAMLQGSAEHAAWLAGRPAAAAGPPGRVIVTRQDATLRIVIDRPAARGAIDRAMRDALFEAFTLAALDDDIDRVVLRATGPTFGVGAELAEFGTTRDPASAHAIRGATLPAHPLSRCAGIVEVHVTGACIGASLELAAFAGRVTAASDAWFQLPELAMGIIPGAGGCVSVPRRIGRQRAALMMLSGKRIDVGTALRWGLIDAIVDAPPVDPGRDHAD